MSFKLNSDMYGLGPASEEILQDHLGREKTKREKDEEPVTRKSKPASLSVLDREENAASLFKKMSSKMAEQSMVEQSETQHTQLNKDLEKKAEAFFASEFQDHTEDSVQLSHVATAYTSVGKKLKDEKDGLKSLHDGLQEDLSQEKDEGSFSLTSKNMKPSLQQSNTTKINQSQKEVQDLIKEYTKSYADTLLKPKQGKSEKLNNLKAKLEVMGVAPKKIVQLEKETQVLLQTDLKKKLKQSFLKFALSYSPKITSELLQNDAELTQIKQMAKQMGLMSDGTMGEIEQEVKEELRGFVSYELDHALTSSRVKGEGLNGLVRAFDRFNTLAGIAKFNSGEYITQIQSKLDNLGLKVFMGAASQGVLDTDDRKRRRSKSQPISDEDIDVVDDQIRAFMMQQNIHSGFFDKAKLGYKFSKLKRQLKSKGLWDESKMKKLKEEARALAQIRLMAIIREYFEVRATLPELSGPEFEMNRKKLKSALKALKAMDIKVPKTELEAIRDEVNRGMFSIIREDYLKLKSMVQSNHKNQSVETRLKVLYGILIRLKQESGILENIESSLFSDAPLNSETRVIEAA